VEHVETITLESEVDASRWRWRALSGRSGTGTLEPLGLRAGDLLVVGLTWRKASWRITRYVRIPDHAWMPAGAASPDPPLVTLDGEVPSFDGRNTPVRAGDVRPVRAPMDPRSTASRDAGTRYKMRPAVVAWVDDERGQVGIHFLYDTNSAVRREGLGRRLVGWREVGLRKPSVASTEQFVRGVHELGERIGRLTATDRATFGVAPDR
jgi:hypothetical protein